MKTALFAQILITLSLIVSAQSSDKFEPFKPSDYPKEKYRIKLDTASFSKFKIEIWQVKKIDNSRDSSSFYCRGWLTVKKDNKILKQFYFKDMEGLGGCSGIFIPVEQPRNDYFIISKFGDYDGRIFIIDTTGSITEKLGGIFYLSKDKRYMFSNYDSDAAGLTIYDLNKRLILYSASEEIPDYLGDWYYQAGKYFARAYDDNDDESEKIKIATFDFTTNKLVITEVDQHYPKTENVLAVFNYYPKNCNCGR